MKNKLYMNCISEYMKQVAPGVYPSTETMNKQVEVIRVIFVRTLENTKRFIEAT